MSHPGDMKCREAAAAAAAMPARQSFLQAGMSTVRKSRASLRRAAVLVTVLSLSSAAMGFGRFEAPPPVREQIEADWLRQDKLRSLPSVPPKAVLPPANNAAGGQPTVIDVTKVLAQGRKLVESQRRLGARVDEQAQVLNQAAEEWSRLSGGAADEVRRQVYFRAHWAVRELELANPLLNFDSILFVKRAPTMFPHMSDQFYGWWSRGGGGIYVLEGFKSGQPRVRCLTTDLPEGNFMGPDLAFDGSRVLFAYARFHPGLSSEKNKADKANVPEDAFYHVFEMNANGGGRRQLTHGKYDDFDARYLPGGGMAFLSTRKGTALQGSAAFSESTRFADLPDSYVRCGGDNWRPVPVFTLHAMDADGTNLRPLSAFENFEWAPSVARDGRLLYTRWDYIDRFNGNFFSLWSANQDGTSPQLVYGNYTVKPQVVSEARSIPGSSKLVFTAGAHHSITGGSICLLDRGRGMEDEAPLTRLTPMRVRLISSSNQPIAAGSFDGPGVVRRRCGGSNNVPRSAPGSFPE